jgi:hypothetical protein
MPRAPHPARRYPGARGVGYPVHRVATTNEWTNPHQVRFTDWTAVCGASGTGDGQGPTGPLKNPFDARQAELCRAGCWE